MANYSIAYPCGHQAEKQLYGKEADRQRYIAWAAKAGTCPACAANDKAAEIDAVEAEYALPELTGSPKQVAWARQLRVASIRKMAAWIAGYRARVVPGKEDAFEEEASAMVTKLVGRAAAAWWIDMRDASERDIAKALKAG